MQAEQYEILFDKAVSYIRTKDKNANLTDEQKLNIYALYKQSTVGNCNIERPGGLFNWERKSMWDAWKALEEKNIKNPKKMCVDYVTSLFKYWQSE